MDELSDTVDRLCTLAGMIMEDCAPIAIFHNPAGQKVRIEAIAAAGRDIMSLADAAFVICARRSQTPPRA